MTDPEKRIDSTMNIFDRFLDRYGPYGFGVLALLLIWFVIVQPELARSKTDYEEFNKGAQVLRDTSHTMRITADVMERTSIRLERMAENERRNTVAENP